MSRIDVIRAELGEFIPSVLQSGVLYVSQKYKTASHLCCCGCGNKVVTPLKPGGWSLTMKGGSVTLYPSIGSWSLPCKSHYLILDSRVVWARQFSRVEIDAVRADDQLMRERYYSDLARHGFWRRIFRRIFGR